MLRDTLFAVFNTVEHRIHCYTSANHGTDWAYHSTLIQMGGEMALGATPSALHLVIEAGFEEIFYSRYLFSEGVWSDTVRISDYNSANSFDPEMVAWGDSNILAVWLDYKYSPYPWTGDLLIRRSIDDGESWIPEQQITFNHLADNKNLYVRNDTVYLVYDEIVLDGETNTEEVFFNWSTDKGETWDNPVRLTNAPYRSIYPAIAVRDNRIHVIYCDARDDTASNPPGYMNSLYYKRGIISSDGINWGSGDRLPEEISLEAFPTPLIHLLQ